MNGDVVESGQQVQGPPGLPSFGCDRGTWCLGTVCHIGTGRMGLAVLLAEAVSDGLSPKSSPCEDGDLRLGVLVVCGHKVAWEPWDILALTRVSSWAWALVCCLVGNCEHLASTVK